MARKNPKKIRKAAAKSAKLVDARKAAKKHVARATAKKARGQ